MKANRTFLLTLTLAGAFAIFLTVSPANAYFPDPDAPDCDRYCTCSSVCAAGCWAGPTYTEWTNCGGYGVCTTSPLCTTCGCSNYIYGTSSADTLHGGSNNDCIYGYEGADTLFGEAGNDKVYGGPNNDTLFGGSGNDCLYGQGGADYLDGGSGHDTCSTGETYVSCND